MCNERERGVRLTPCVRAAESGERRRERERTAEANSKRSTEKRPADGKAPVRGIYSYHAASDERIDRGSE